ncbi:MAG: PAS domain-containing protein [Parvibaculum sp.]|uniref:PAS domain-containing protein n=1 Tax=Parvibaculum sp. TaxID=2024848 RepID=UPI0025D78CBF|nr:PAS domain-containing protein [Parvibaculum sp.]MCE9650045.1 PAS domain-containing protein [Parvibaculum sp.]
MQAATRPVSIEIDPASLGNPVLAAVKDYFDGKRGVRRAACRADLNPAELKAHLGWISLLDVLRGGEDFHHRLVGTRVAHYFSIDNTGRLLSDVAASYSPEVAAGILGIHRKAANEMVQVHVSGRADWIGKQYLDFDALFLPLSDNGESANMLVSVFTFDYGPLRSSMISGLS